MKRIIHLFHVQAIKLNPDSPRLYRIIGDVNVKKGRFALAQKDFARACQMGAKDSCARAKSLAEKLRAGRKNQIFLSAAKWRALDDEKIYGG